MEDETRAHKAALERHRALDVQVQMSTSLLVEVNYFSAEVN